LTLRNPATGEQADVWLYPADPELPALRTAVYAESASVVLGRLGLPVDGVRVSLAAYRPGKRAVVRVDATDAAYFLKVVRPSKAEPLQAQHTLWREAGMAVPRVLGWSDEGLVALEALDGVEMIGVLDRVTEPSALLDAIARVTEGIGAVRSIAVARASLVRRVDWYEGRLLELLPNTPASSQAWWSLSVGVTALPEPHRRPTRFTATFILPRFWLIMSTRLR
jgi:hypothetical protein